MSTYLHDGFIRHAWYVAAWSHEVTAGALFSRTLLGEPVVFYRTQVGAVCALKNQCCHRAAPLSHGRLEGDCVRCLYHGMKFNAQGVCVEIPGQDMIPAKACVPSYPVEERDGFIWIWMGDPKQANPADILDFFWHTSPQWAMKPGYIHYNASYQLVVDNLLDFSHLSFVHPTTLGTSASAQTRSQVERVGTGLKITRWDLNCELSPNHKRVAAFTGPADRWQIYEWHPPAFLRMDAGSSPAGTGAQQGQRVKETIQFRHTSVQTPETANTTHYFFCQARNFALDKPEMTDAIFQDVLTAFGEDRSIIEGQQKILDLDPHFEPVAIQHDKGLSMARMLLREQLEKESS